MTIYDLASEDEQTNLYNLLLSPSEEEKQVVFSCHLRRGGPDAKSPPTYELVNFVGYFSKSVLTQHSIMRVVESKTEINEKTDVSNKFAKNIFCHYPEVSSIIVETSEMI